MIPKRFLFALLLLANALNAQERLYTYDVEERIKELGIELSAPNIPPGLNIELAVQSGNLIYLSGNGPIRPNGERITGKVGKALTTEEGYEAARITAINHLAILKAKIGDLNKVVKIVKVLGQCRPRLYGASQSHQWIYGSHDSGFWRTRKTCPIGHGHGFIALEPCL